MTAILYQLVDDDPELGPIPLGEPTYDYSTVLEARRLLLLTGMASADSLRIVHRVNP